MKKQKTKRATREKPDAPASKNNSQDISGQQRTAANPRGHKMKKKSRRENPDTLARKMLRKLVPRKSAALVAIADELERMEFGESQHLTLIMDMAHPPRDCQPHEKRRTYGDLTILHPKCTKNNCVHQGMPVPGLPPTKSLAQIAEEIEAIKKGQHEK